MQLEVVERNDDVRMVRLAGRLDLKGVEAVQMAFLMRTARQSAPVIVDLSGLTFLGSLGIGMIFDAARTLRMRKARLVLLDPTPHIEEVLRTACIEEIAPIVHGEAEALAALGAG